MFLNNVFEFLFFEAKFWSVLWLPQLTLKMFKKKSVNFTLPLSKIFVISGRFSWSGSNLSAKCRIVNLFHAGLIKNG